MARLVEIPYKPRPVQKELHENLEKFRWSIIVAHRRMGKTVAVINHLIKMAAKCDKEMPRYAYIAPLYKQAKTIAWDYLKKYTGAIPGLKVNESELWVELPNTGRIRLFGADNPDALRGIYLDGAVFDEVADMKYELWDEVVRPTLADRKGFAIFIGTPRGIDHFHKLWTEALDRSDWYAAMYRAEDTNVLAPDELAANRLDMSEAKYRQEYECDFTASSEDVLISIDLVDSAYGKHLHPQSYHHAPLVYGIDVARFGDDKSVIAKRRGLMLFNLIKFKELDTMQFSSRIAHLWKKEKPDAVFVDDIGVGGGVVDRLRQLGLNPIGINSGGKATNTGVCNNKRTEMWCDIKLWLQNGGALPADLELKNDLTSIRYDYDGQNRKRLEKTEDFKARLNHSPDCGTALALTFAAPVAIQGRFDQDRDLLWQDWTKSDGDYNILEYR